MLACTHLMPWIFWGLFSLEFGESKSGPGKATRQGLAFPEAVAPSLETYPSPPLGPPLPATHPDITSLPGDPPSHPSPDPLPYLGHHSHAFAGLPGAATAESRADVNSKVKLRWGRGPGRFGGKPGNRPYLLHSAAAARAGAEATD